MRIELQLREPGRLVSINDSLQTVCGVFSRVQLKGIMEFRSAAGFNVVNNER
jgi:hypothetical protein